MLAINAKLQSALAPSIDQAGAPAIKMIPPVPAPLLQSTAAPSIANSVPNSGANSFNNWTAATPHAVSSPNRRAASPAAPKPPAPSNATQPETPAPAPAGAQPPAPPTPTPAVLPSVTPDPPPVTVVGSPPAIPPMPGLSAAATTTVTAVPQPDLGDSVASGGETHGGQRGDRSSANPDLTATPAGPDAAWDSEVRPEGKNGEDGNDDAGPRGPLDSPEQAGEHG